jgi:hypothetical protein
MSEIEKLNKIIIDNECIGILTAELSKRMEDLTSKNI